MRQKKEVTTIRGHLLMVDTSLEVCTAFGFMPGQKVLDPYDRKGEVLGVAPLPISSSCIEAGTCVLWLMVEGVEGAIFFPDPKKDLKPVGDKWHPAHVVAGYLLMDAAKHIYDPIDEFTLVVIARMYAAGVKVPQDAIPWLVEQFQIARGKIHLEPEDQALVSLAIGQIKQQSIEYKAE